MSQVCDFEDQSINLDTVAQHFGGIISYVSDYTPKNLTATNLQKALTLGLTVNLVCEQGAQPALRGTAGGTHDATIANQQATTIGYDPGAWLLYVAEDPSQLSSTQWPTVEQYFQAVAAVGGRPVGGYGGWKTLNYLHGLGLISKGWMVSTWNQGAPNPLPDWIVLTQLVGGTTYGLPIDVDNVLNTDYGQMPRSAPTPPSEEGFMPVSATFPWNTQRHGFQVYGGALWHRWAIGTPSPVKENLSAKAPQAITIPDQTPQVTLSAADVEVAVEDSNKVEWVFSQSANSGTWAVWQLA